MRSVILGTLAPMGINGADGLRPAVRWLPARLFVRLRDLAAPVNRWKAPPISAGSTNRGDWSVPRIGSPARLATSVLQKRDSLQCRDRIHLHDHTVSPSELLAAADGFRPQLVFEGWPLTSMEALFAGVPGLLSDVGGARGHVDPDSARAPCWGYALEDPPAVDWESFAAANSRHQVNKDELVAAMLFLVQNREDYLNAGQSLTSGSAAYFRPDICFAQHATPLRSVVIAEQSGPAVVRAADLYRGRQLTGSGQSSGTVGSGRSRRSAQPDLKTEYDLSSELSMSGLIV